MTYHSDTEVVDAALSISLVPVRLALGILKDATAVELAKHEFRLWDVDSAYHRLVGPLESELGIAPVYNRVELTDADRAAVAKAAVVSKGAVEDALDVLRTYAAAKDDDQLLAQMVYQGLVPPLIPPTRDELVTARYQGLVRMFKEGAGIQNLADRFHTGIILTIENDDKSPYFQKGLPQRGRFSESNTQPDKQPVTFFEYSPLKEEKDYKPLKDYKPFEGLLQKTKQGTVPDPSRFYEALLKELKSGGSLSIDPSLSNNTPPLRTKISITPDLENSQPERDVPVIKIPLGFSDEFSYLRPEKRLDTERLGQSEREILFSELKPKDK